MPLWQLLGGVKSEVESGLAVGLYDSRDALWAAIDRELAAGAYKRVKVKIAPGHDVELVREVRRRYPSTPLMTDANAAYKITDAPIFEHLDEFGLLMFEQPLAGAAFEIQPRCRSGFARRFASTRAWNIRMTFLVRRRWVRARSRISRSSAWAGWRTH